MLAVYDLCVDDDEDIRDIGSKLTQKILAPQGGKSGISLAPLVASQRLSENLVARFPQSQVLAIEALRRFWGCDTTDAKTPRTMSPRTAITLAQSETDVLFREEKQNLFIDPASETVIWARVLRKMPSTALPRSLRKEFASWVAEGLRVLTETPESGTDLPRSLSSQPEVFALGVRVLYGAEVVLTWLRASSRRSTDTEKVLACLGRFVDGVPAASSGVWSEIARRVLREYAIARLSSLHKTMSTMIA
jgi:hypothetical protein